jgi:hypothetical protein
MKVAAAFVMCLSIFSGLYAVPDTVPIPPRDSERNDDADSDDGTSRNDDPITNQAAPGPATNRSAAQTIASAFELSKKNVESLLEILIHSQMTDSIPELNKILNSSLWNLSEDDLQNISNLKTLKIDLGNFLRATGVGQALTDRQLLSPQVLTSLVEVPDISGALLDPKQFSVPTYREKTMKGWTKRYSELAIEMVETMAKNPQLRLHLGQKFEALERGFLAWRWNERYTAMLYNLFGLALVPGAAYIWTYLAIFRDWAPMDPNIYLIANPIAADLFYVVFQYIKGGHALDSHHWNLPRTTMFRLLGEGLFIPPYAQGKNQIAWLRSYLSERVDPKLLSAQPFKWIAESELAKHLRAVDSAASGVMNGHEAKLFRKLFDDFSARRKSVAKIKAGLDQLLTGMGKRLPASLANRNVFASEVILSHTDYHNCLFDLARLGIPP